MPTPQAPPELFYASRPPKTLTRYRHCEEHLRRSNPYLRAALWIASRSLPSGAHSRDPVARNDGLQFCVVDRLETIERARDRRQRVFKPGRAIEQHHAIVFRDAAIGEALLVGGVGRSP